MDQTGTVACSACGVVHEAATELVEELKQTIANLHSDCDQKMRRIKALQTESDQKLRNNRRYDEACDVLTFWQKTCHPKAREVFSIDRVKVVIARLNGDYTVEMLKECCEGYSLKPFMIEGRRVAHGRPEHRKVDAIFIFNDPRRVDQGLALAQQGHDYQEVLTPEVKTSILSELGFAALRYAKAGWPVFPCQANAKTPIPGSKGLLDAKADPQRVQWYWSRHPDQNVGIRTGRESGIVILDVDDDKGGLSSLHDLEAEFGALPRTARVVTPRGGSHYYFRHPGVEIRNTQGVPGPGLDVRGDGGYALGIPSVVEGRSYHVDVSIAEAGIKDMPNWLVGRLRDYQTKIGERVDPKVWEELVGKGAPEGERNGRMISLAGYLLNKFPNPAEHGIALGFMKNTNRETFHPPMADREVEQVFASALKMRRREQMRLVA